ncbi:MAG: GNAT family N-acetyltransferase [Kofleriaceae bacterium]|nr:GNAT family N-acetyltransferase [Kofleriaceae bacterium]MBP9170797.1 GNAT family N-acetyltransferase [Kofleriaceae bacterium]MBP9857688.1 GNAT family N-acetyltransferase [Kofleriaceae bacterium]
MITRLPSVQPELTTPRLRLRAFVPTDRAAVMALAGDAAVAEFLLHLAHPMTAEAADDWVRSAIDDWAIGGSPTWAVTRRRGGRVVGAVWLRWAPRHDRAELGYWLGRRSWGHGYAREAAAAAVGFGFDVLGVHRVFAQHLDGNLRSAAVLEAIGMAFEGVRRGHVKRRGAYRDLYGYAIVRP